MKEVRTPFAEIELIVVTGVTLGVGLGLLVAGHESSRRQRIGWLLLMIGGISTFPLRADVVRRERSLDQTLGQHSRLDARSASYSH